MRREDENGVHGGGTAGCTKYQNGGEFWQDDSRTDVATASWCATMAICSVVLGATRDKAKDARQDEHCCEFHFVPVPRDNCPLEISSADPSVGASSHSVDVRYSKSNTCLPLFSFKTTGRNANSRGGGREKRESVRPSNQDEVFSGRITLADECFDFVGRQRNPDKWPFRAQRHDAS